jgi:excisionase family DNA binding protein
MTSRNRQNSPQRAGAWTTAQAAEYLQISERGLRRMRRQRTGPPFYYVGNLVRYRPEDLDAYLERHRVEPVREGVA